MDTLVSGAPLAKKTAFKMAGIELKDINFAELYDCYTFTVLVTLEDYGFCKKGEGGPFVEGGRIGPKGSLPVKYRRRTAQLILYVGHDPARRRYRANARRGGRAPGAAA